MAKKKKATPRRGANASKFAVALGQKIRLARIGQGLTLDQASGRSHGIIGLSWWGDIENGKGEVNLVSYLAMCVALGQTPEGMLPEDYQALLA